MSEPPSEFVDNVTRPTVVWRCFDPDADLDVSVRNRPHWHQAGAVTFVTIRLDDSMPVAVVKQWLHAQQDWLTQQGLGEISVDAMLARNDLPRDLRRAFTKFRNRLWNTNLDDCHGSCCLRNRAHAKIVADSLLHFDGVRYDIERFVVMPNHVHVLVQMFQSWGLREQCESWMRYTATQINRSMGKGGDFWAEPFDHVVRNPTQFDYLQRYIVDNPDRASLSSQETLTWIRHEGFK